MSSCRILSQKDFARLRKNQLQKRTQLTLRPAAHTKTVVNPVKPEIFAKISEMDLEEPSAKRAKISCLEDSTKITNKEDSPAIAVITPRR